MWKRRLFPQVFWVHLPKNVINEFARNYFIHCLFIVMCTISFTVYCFLHIFKLSTVVKKISYAEVLNKSFYKEIYN